MGSVKELRVETPASEAALGRGSFIFSDDYSVFDWGRMPDQIPHKGATLCAMGAYNFEALERAGVPTHYRGIVDDGSVVGFDEATSAPREMAIEVVQVPPLAFGPDGYDYEAYHAEGGESFLVPLEVVFRNAVPPGSSLRRRTAPADHGLDMDDWPPGPVALDEPIVEFSTKFEERDRYLDRAEAAVIAGPAALDDLERLARAVDDLVTERAERAGLTHHDGKIECLYHTDEVHVADVAGTFDESRFSAEDRQVSKEVLRQYYKRAHPDWVEAVAAAKAEAERRDTADWRELCAAEPPSLPAAVVSAAADLYAAGANAYLGRELFEAPALDEALDRLDELR